MALVMLGVAHPHLFSVVISRGVRPVDTLNITWQKSTTLSYRVSPGAMLNCHHRLHSVGLLFEHLDFSRESLISSCLTYVQES